MAFLSLDHENSIKIFLEVLEQRKWQGFQFYTCEAYMNIANFYFEKADMVKGALYIDSCIVLAERHNLLLTQIEALELNLEYEKTTELRQKLTQLKQKRKQVINRNNNRRKSLNVKKNKAESSRIYFLLSLLIIPALIWWIYTKD